MQFQKEGLNGLDSAFFRRVTSLASKRKSELSFDMETLFSISDTHHAVSTHIISTHEQKVVDDFT